MPVRIARGKDIPVMNLRGRDMWRLATPETLGAKDAMLVLVSVNPGNTTGECHSHPDSEEIMYVLSGQGETWVDGEIAQFTTGDALLFPRRSKHMTRNIGNEPLRLACVFAPPSHPDRYEMHPEITFPETRETEVVE